MVMGLIRKSKSKIYWVIIIIIIITTGLFLSYKIN